MQDSAVQLIPVANVFSKFSYCSEERTQDENWTLRSQFFFYH